jgi:hypothetical protein
MFWAWSKGLLVTEPRNSITTFVFDSQSQLGLGMRARARKKHPQTAKAVNLPALSGSSSHF